MAISAENSYHTRILCLGNDILADDAFGITVAHELRPRMPGNVDVVDCMESGFRLIDHLVGVSRVVVVDTLQTGRAEPGTIYTFREDEVESVPGNSPHYIGLFETLAVARALRLPAAQELIIVAVEAADCTSFGGDMHPAVRRAVVDVTRLVEELTRRHA